MSQNAEGRSAIRALNGSVLSRPYSLLAAIFLLPALVGAQSIEKTGPETVTAGSSFEYLLTITNDDNEAIADVRVLDQLPAGLQWVDASSDDGFSCLEDPDTEGLVECSRGTDLPPGDSEILIEVIAGAPADSTLVTNTARLEVGAVEVDSDSAETTISPVADLRVSQSLSPASVLAGQEVRYSFAISNQGPSPAAGLTLTTSFDPAVASASINSPATGWNCELLLAGTVLQCDRDAPLDADSSQTVEVDIVMPGVASETEIESIATVTSNAELPDQPDNVSEAATVTVTPSADLSVTRSAWPGAALDAESAFSYQLQIDNAGPSPATDLVVTETVPAGALLQSVSGAGWDCRINQQTGELACTRATLAAAAGSLLSVSVLAPRNPPVVGELEGSVTGSDAAVAGATHDPDLTNNAVAGQPLTVRAAWSLSITKDASGELLVPGQTFRYEITVTNDGPSDLLGDIRPALNDAFDNRLRGGQQTPNACPAPAQFPCWGCTSTPRPALQQALDSDSAALLGLGGARQVALSPDRRHVYAAGRFDDGLARFSRATDRGTGFGQVAYQGYTAAGTRPGAVLVHPTGDWLLVAESGDSARLLLLARDPADGSLGTAASVINGLDEPTQLLLNAAGSVLYVAERGADRISVFALDVEVGELNPLQQIERSSEVLLAGVSGLALSADESHLYAAAALDQALVSFAVAGDGQLSALATPSIVPQGGGSAIALRAVAVQPQGNEIYVGGGNAVVVFQRGSNGEPGAYAITRASITPARLLDGIVDIKAGLDGHSLYVAASDDRAVSAFVRKDDGILGFARSVQLEAGMRPNAMAMDAGGEQLYVVSSSADPDGAVEPDRNRIEVYGLAASGLCGTLRTGELGLGDIDALPLTLPAGQSVVVGVRAAVKTNTTAGFIDNIAELIDADDELIDDDVEVEVSVATRVSVSVSAPDERPIPGTEFTYTLRVENQGPSNLNELRLDSILPAFTAGGEPGFVGGSAAWTCLADAGTGACCQAGGNASQCGQLTIPASGVGSLDGQRLDLPANSGLSFRLRGRIHPSSPPLGELSQMASLTMPVGVDPFDPDDLVDVLETPIDAQLDVWLIKDSLGVRRSNDPVTVEYRLRVGNNGPATAVGVVVEDLLADDSFISGSAIWSCSITQAGEAALAPSCCEATDGQCSQTNLSEQNGLIDREMILASGARAEFLIEVAVEEPLPELVVNNARILPPPGVTDTDPTNNQQTRNVRLLAEANLGLEKVVSAGGTTPGEQVVYTVTLSNDGPDDVPVTVEDILPPELIDVTWVCDATTPIPGDLSYQFHTGLGAGLVEPRAVVSSADGRHVYMAGFGGVFTDGEEPSPASIAVFERNILPGPDFGALTLIETEIDGINDPDDSGLAVELLAGASSMALSPDQRYLYVAASTPGAVVVFRRDHVPASPRFGRLTFVESRANGSSEPGDLVTPVVGLNGAVDVVVSPDGEHVYLAAIAADAVTVFRRNLATGALNFQGQLSANQIQAQSPNGLRRPVDLQMAPDGRQIYVTSKGPALSFSGSSWSLSDQRATVGGQSYFVPNTAGVALKWLQLDQPLMIDDSDGLTLSFDHIFSLDWATSCFDVGVLEISVDGGESWEDVIAAGGQWVGPSGRYNGTQNGLEDNPLSDRPGWCSNSPGWGSGQFETATINLSQAVPDNSALMLRWGLGEGFSLGGAGWWIDNIQVYLDSNPGDPLLVDQALGGEGGATIVSLARASDSAAQGFGDLSFLAAQALDDGADAAAMDPDGIHLYVGNATTDAIVRLDRNIQSGMLSAPQPAVTDDDGDPLQIDALGGLAALAISPDGEHLVASGAGANQLVVFRRDLFGGALSPMQELALNAPADAPVNGGIEAVLDIDFSSDGQHVFTAAAVGQLGVFSRRAPDPTFGFLEAVINEQDDGFGGIAVGLLGARASALSDNGRYLFVAGFGQIGGAERGSLVVLERDPTSTEIGQNLRFRQVFRDQQGGVQGLDGAIDVVVVGQDIYLAAERSNAVTHFRQQENGLVQFVGSYVNGGGISGLLGVSGLAATAGGDRLYAAGRFDNAVAIFNRNVVDGSLSFAGEVRQGVAGASGLQGANALVVSGDDAYLYVASRESDAVAVFAIDGDALEFRQAFFDGTEGAVLTSPTAIAISREGAGGGEHIMVTSLDGNAVTVLRRQTDPSQPSLLGRVRFQQSLVHGSPGVDALRSPRGIVVDPDNDRVYVASEVDNALVILLRNTSPGGAQFGMLSPLEVRRDGSGGVVALNRPYGLAVSEGARRNIYAASLGSQSVTAFVRRSGSSCAGSGVGNLSEPVFIAANGTVRFIISGTIAPGATDELVNTASLIIADDVTNTGDTEQSTATSQLAPRSVLEIDKTNNRLSLVAGERQNYEITVRNQGPSHAAAVQISDLLSANPQFDVDSAEWSCRAVGAGLLSRRDSRLAASDEDRGLVGAAGQVWTVAADPLIGPRLYLSGVLGNALSVYGFDPLSGELVHEFDLFEGGTDALGTSLTGLRGARGLAASADGRFIYLGSQIDNTISVFEVIVDPDDEAYGSLVRRQSLDPASAGLAGLNQPIGLTLSADGGQLYVAAANASAIYVFDRLPNGSLSLNQIVENNSTLRIDGVSALVLGPEDQHLYAAGTNAASVAVFARGADGSLTHLQTRASPATAGLGGAVDLVLDEDGAQLYVLGRDDNAIVAFNRNHDSASAEFGRLASGVAQRIDQGQVPDLISPRSIVISPDGGSVYVAAYGSNSVLAFRRDRNNGQLSFLNRYRDATGQSGLIGVSSLVISGDGQSLFAGALVDGAVTRFQLAGFSRCGEDSGVGDVELEADIAAGGSVIISLGVNTVPATNGQSCPAPLDPSRRCVINTVSASLTQSDETTNYQARDISFLERAANLVVTKTDGLSEYRGLADARALAASDELGQHLYVASRAEPGIGVYAIEPVTGAPTGDYPLRFVQLVRNGQDGVSLLNGISDVLVSPDGRHVYASSSLDNAVVRFERQPGTGRLRIGTVYRNNLGGISGLSGPRSLAMSEDGRHLYVAAANSNSIVIFDRQSDETEAGFGALSWQGTVQNGTNGVQQLLAPEHIVLSPDGQHLYAAAPGSNAVVAFRRASDEAEPGHGGLTWLQARVNLVGPVNGLLDVSRLLLSADGGHLYAAGTGNNAIVHFQRINNASASNFGRLEYMATAIDDNNGFEGLAGVSDLAFGGSGQQWLMAVSLVDGSLARISRDTVSGGLVFDSRVIEGQLQDDDSGPVVVRGLAAARRAVSLPGSSAVYVASAVPGALAAFDTSGSQLSWDGALIQGGGGAVPGTQVTYEIVVRNEGPSRVQGVRVIDIFPAEFEAVTWECSFGSPDSACAGPGVGNIDTLVNLAAGDSITFLATGQLRSDAAGLVVNQARVILPGDVTDLDPSSNLAVDDDTIISGRADLSVEFFDLPTTLTAGETVQYRLRVANDGPSDTRTALLEHRLPEAFGNADWICEADREPGTLSLQDPPPGLLDLTRASALSQDGRHLYVLGDAGVGALAIYSRNTLTGALAPVDLLLNLSQQATAAGNVTIDGLAGARALRVSEDDLNVYVVGYDDDAIATFSRDPVSGQLEFRQVLRDSIGSVDGLGGPVALTLSAGGDSLYVASELDNAVAVFARETNSGLLSFVQVRRNGQAGVQGLLSPSDLQLTDQDATLLVASPGGNSIVRFQRATNGTLTYAGRFQQGAQADPGTLFDGLAGVRSLALSDDGRWLYSLSRDGVDAALAIFERTAADHLIPSAVLREGDLVGIPPQPVAGLIGASELLLTRDQRQLYVAGLDDDSGERSIVAFRVLAGADLQFLGRYAGSVASAPGQHHSLSSGSDGRHLYATGTGDSALDIFRRLGGSSCGRSGQGIIVDTVDLEAGGSLVYDISARVLANARGTVSADAVIRSASAGQDPELDNNTDSFSLGIEAAVALAVEKTLMTDPVVAGEPVSWQITVSNHGPSSVSGIDVIDALPVLPGNLPNPGAAGVVAGSASWMCSDTNHLIDIQRLSDSGLAGARGMAFSPDGRLAAVVGQASDSISLYLRQPNGQLLLLERLTDGDLLFDEDGVEIGQISGLAGAADVAFSPDQRHLVVAAAQANALAVFALDPDLDQLRFVEARFNGEATISGLVEPVRVRFSDDGESLYVASRSANAINLFSRQPVTGRLSWIENQRSGLGGLPVNALDGVRDLVISPDGRHLYAAAAARNSIVRFDRNSDGSLRYRASLANGDSAGGSAVVGLGLVQSLAISPKGRHLYAASLADDSVTVFSRDVSSGELTPGAHYRDGIGGLTGLDGANGVLVSPDGENLYLTARNDGNLLVFARDWVNGELRLLETFSSDALGDVRMMSMAPGGDGLLVSAGSGTVSNLRRQAEGYCGLQTSQSDTLLDTVELAAGGSVSYQVNALVHPGARGELVNTAFAELPPNTTPLTPANQDDSVASAIEVVTDLAIIKTIDGEASVLVAGGNVRYVLDVSNAGPSHAFEAEIHDLLPAAIVAASWQCQTIPADSIGSQCGSGSGDVLDLVDLVVGERLLYLIDGDLSSTFIGQLLNTGSVLPPLGATDPDPGNNNDSVSATVGAVADVFVSKTALQPVASPGQTLGFEIRVGNTGPSDAPQVAVVDILPAGMSAVGWTCEVESGATSCPAASGIGNLDLVLALAAGDSLLFTLEASIDADLSLPVQLTNQVTATVLGSQVGDPNLGNNQAVAIVSVTELLADIQASKSVDRAEADPGDPLVYTIEISNAGPGPAAEVSIVDVMPLVLTDVNWTCQGLAGADCPVDAGLGNIELTASLPAGASLVFTATALVDPDLVVMPGQTVINLVSAVLQGDGVDPNPDNNQASAVTRLDSDSLFRDRFEALSPRQGDKP